MCHLVLFMPLFGLAVFWFWPPAVAVPLYAAILAFSAMIYVAVARAMCRPVQTGAKGMAHRIAEAIEFSNTEGWVRVQGEIWRAISDEPLRKGDRAEVVGVDGGLTLRVRRASPANQKPPSGPACGG